MEKMQSFQVSLPHPICQLVQGGPCSVCVKRGQNKPRIEELRRQLDEAQQAYDRAIQDDRQLVSDMNRIHNPTILRLPVEVASAIFQLCVPPVTVNSSVKDLRKHRRMLLSLGGVCHGWRDITLATQRLWTTISLCMTSSFARSNLPRWKEFLTRSGQLPLSIYVYEMPEENTTEDLVSEVVDVLKLHLNRLRDLRIDVSIQHLPLLQDVSDASMPHPLETLQIRCPDEENDFEEFLLDLNFKPTNLTLQRVPLEWLSIRWSSLVYLEVTRIFSADCSKLLKQAPLLKRCRFSEILEADWSDDRLLIPVVLPRLEELELAVPSATTDVWGGADVEHVEELLDTFTFPALRVLRLNLNEQQLPFDHLLPLLQRSSCDLRILCIVNTILDTITLINFLQELPTLEELTIDPSNYSDYSLGSFLSALAQPSIAACQSNLRAIGPPRILPKLRSLKHQASYHGSIPWHFIPRIFGIGSISDLQQGPEWRPLHSLKLFIFQSQPPEKWDVDFNVVPFLLAIRAAGFDLDIVNLTTGQNVLTHEPSTHSRQSVPAA